MKRVISIGDARQHLTVSAFDSAGIKPIPEGGAVLETTAAGLAKSTVQALPNAIEEEH